MEELLKKVTHYQLFNYLLSGAVFVAALDKTTNVHLGSDDAILAFFIYYFVGMVISRLGSLIVEPTLKLLRVVKFKPYGEYIKAVGLDAKLDTLSQENNTYRTLIATFLLYIVFYLSNLQFGGWLTRNSTISLLLGAGALLVLFVFAYHKQTNYITSRIDKALKKEKQ